MRGDVILKDAILSGVPCVLFLGQAINGGPSALADAICAALDGKPLPELTELPPFEKLPRSFDNPGRYSVAVGVLHNSGTQ